MNEAEHAIYRAAFAAEFVRVNAGGHANYGGLNVTNMTPTIEKIGRRANFVAHMAVEAYRKSSQGD